MKKLALSLILSSTLLSACGDGQDDSSLNNTETQNLADATALLANVESLLDGKGINDVIAKAKVGRTPSQNEINAYWDVYKAKNGIDFTSSSVQVEGKGAKRHANLKNGLTRIKSAFTLVQNNPTTIDTWHRLRQKFNTIYLNAYKERSGQTHNVPFLIYAKIPEGEKVTFDQQIARIEPFLKKLPEAHRLYSFPILVVDSMAGGRLYGAGRYTHEEVETLLKGNQAKTGIPDTDLDDMLNLQNQGVILVSKNAVLGITAESIATCQKKETPAEKKRCLANPPREFTAEFSFLHEFGHNVDDFKRIYPQGSKAINWEGQKYTKNPTSVKELAAEAYSRYFINKNRLCRDMTDAELRNCNKRTIEHMQKADAFKGLGITL